MEQCKKYSTILNKRQDFEKVDARISVISELEDRIKSCKILLSKKDEARLVLFFDCLQRIL